MIKLAAPIAHSTSWTGFGMNTKASERSIQTGEEIFCAGNLQSH